MPSAAKKRKIAKKKKKKQANNNDYSVIHSHEDDDLQVHEEKESNGAMEMENREDSATVRSVVSESETMVGTNGNGGFTQNVMRDGKEEELDKREDAATVRSIVSKSELMVGINCNGGYTQKMVRDREVEETKKREDAATVRSILSESGATVGINSNGKGIRVVMDKNNAKQIDIELKPEGDSNIKKVNIKYVEESNGGLMALDGARSSSSDSSDDEFHAVEKNVMVIESGESEFDAPNFTSGSVAFANSVELTGLPEVTQVNDGVPIMDAYSLVVSEPKQEAHNPVATNVPSVNLVKPADLPEVTQVTDGVLFIEAYSLVDSENGSKEVISVNSSLSVENAMRSNEFKLGLKENGKHEVSGVSPVAMDMRSQPNEDKVASAEYKNSAVSSGVVVFGVQEDENKLSASSEIPSVDNINGGEHIEGSVISECSDRQPLVASAQRAVQTTSWKSCCGLFELFTGVER
ncbi:uncharacterized protein LOC130753117 isoform X2 [Actinidia eriantha]|uniref:uncharacterized protein LOC130753117 isoform X2 n=1 Tax=Actinidia eriantha TaxID=165200 RepID=UPI00258610A6|nr:uncharacterized protein LOC130753117 isoform X2 [Actinidia eriantha]